MLYFATYEKLKQFARKAIIYREEQQLGASNNSTATRGGVIDYRTDRRPLDLGTYMVCVAGAVAISATVCHTVDALRVHIKELWTTSVLPTKSTSTLSPISPTPSSSSTAFRTSGSILTANHMAPTLTTASQQHHPHMSASPAHAHAAVTQHANMTTTTTTPIQLPRRPLVASGNGTHHHLQWRKQQQGGLLRRLSRGLGPRVMWTAPGVTLTTAGFEVFRNIALGVMHQSVSFSIEPFV
ncbi:hypothetical protein BGX24_005608 [Mortierella sp. AD032]|nr:hypothetical protein BGX24_005608 [Mortierella sp. AD032]